MKPIVTFSFILALICSTCSCEAQPQKELFNVLLGTDHHSPILLETTAVDTHTVTYRFNEMVFCSADDFSCEEPTQHITSVHPYEETITITFGRPLVPGKRISVSGIVADQMGNTLTFTRGVWGCNPDLPKIKINEFSTKGSASNPDRVELITLSDGNLAGLTCYIGMPQTFDAEFVFPAIDVQQGEYIVLTYGQKPSGECTYDLYAGEEGIGANNGVISLCDRPEGTVIDAVLYSNRTSESDENYSGFGTKKVQTWAQLLEDSGQWLPLPTTPEIAIDSTDHTATRTFCRTQGEIDTHSKDDWHIVPTRQGSFGEPNSDEVYAP